MPTLSWSPDPATPIHVTAGQPFNQTIIFSYDPGATTNYINDVGLVNSPSAPDVPASYLATGTEVFPGVSLLANPDGGGGWPSTNLYTPISIRIPIATVNPNVVKGASGYTYEVYVRGTYFRWNPQLQDFVEQFSNVTYTFVVDSPNSLQLSPAANISTPTTINSSSGNNFIVGTSQWSVPINIQNGVGPYQVTLLGLESHPEMGINTFAGVPGTIVQSIPSTTASTLYLVGNPSGPTGGGGQTFTLQVIDKRSVSPTLATYAGTYYKYVAVSSSGGTLNITESGSGSSNLIQSKPASVQFVTTNGTGLYNPGAWTLGNGTTVPPPGLSINNNGLISGIPTSSGQFNFVINATDTASNTGSLTVTWFIQAGVTITGSGFHSGTSGSAYTPDTVFTASGGDNTYRWYVSDVGLLQSAGFTVNGTAFGSLPVSGAYRYKDTVTPTLTITSLNLSAAGSSSIGVYATSNGGAITSNTITSTLSISSTGTLTFTPTPPATLPHAKQFQAYTTNITTTGSANFIWNPTTGLPSPLVDNHSTTGSTLTISGTPTTYGSSFAVGVSVTDATSATGFVTYPFVIDPDIKFVGATSPTRLKNATRGASYSDYLTFSGGDSTGFSYSVGTVSNPLPSGISYQVSGTNNEILTFLTTGSNTVQATAVVDYAIPVTVTVNTVSRPGNPTFTTSFNVLITINGTTAVTLSPFTTTLCAYEAPWLSPTIPSIKVGAIVQKGTSNTYSVTSVPAGWAYQGAGSPINIGSASGAVFAQTTPSSAGNPYNFILQADEDGAATATVAVNVTTSVNTYPLITPNTAILYAAGSKRQQSFTAAVNHTCANSMGIWYIDSAGSGINISTPRANSTTLTAPSVISAPFEYYLDFQADELAGNAGAVKTPVVLLPGTSDGNVLTINTGALTNGTVTVGYGPVTFAASGNVPTYTWSMLGNLPQGMTFSNVGVLQGTPTEQGDFTFVVVVHDSSATPFWAAKFYTLHIGGAGSLSLGAISPNFGPSTGGTACTLTGTGFLAGDRIFFVSGQVQGVSVEQTVNSISAGSISLTTVAHVGLEVNSPVAVALLRSGVYTYNLGTPGVPGTGVYFTYGTPNFTVDNFTPDSANADQVAAVNMVVSGQGFNGSCVVVYHPNIIGGIDNDLTTTFNSSTGTLTATVPNTFFVSGTYSNTTATIKVKNTLDNTVVTCGTKTFRVISSDPVITTTSLPDADRTGGIVTYSGSLTVSGGVAPYTWSFTGSLPSGINLSSGGVLSGTVGIGAQTSTPTFKVTDGNGKVGTAAITIKVIGGSLQWVTTSLPDARISSLYSKQLQVTGGNGTYTFSLNTGAFPTPVNVTPSGANAGLISGTPADTNSVGQYTVSISATDGVLSIGPTTFTLNLLPALPTVTVTSINPTSGPVAGGIAVDIFGTNFANGCSVKFGQTAATGLNYSNIPTKVTATLPAGTVGLVDVTVTNPDTSYGVFPASFEYKELTSPIIQSISRQDGPFVGGQKVILFGTNFQGITSVRFGLVDDITAQNATWATTDLNLGSNPQQLTITTPAGFSFGTGTTPVDVNIYVTNASGTGVLAAGVNGYTYRPAPIITAVVPNTGPTAGQQPIYVIGSNFFSRNGVNPRVFIGDVEIPPSQIVFKEK